ncbi:MAG: hypothetical protein SNJ82_13965 [Gemmataceae bacterium]
MITWTYSLLGSMLILTAGLIHGFWTDRWGRSEDTQQAAQRLH